MTAIQRRKRAYYQRRRQRRSRKILNRRRKPYIRRRRRRTKHAIRFARSNYRKRRLPTSRYLKKAKPTISSSQKAKPTISSYRNELYHRKPSRVGRPRKKKHPTRTRRRFLQRKLRATVGRKRTKHTSTPVEKKAKRKPRYSDDEIFYSLANSSTPKATSEERQSKKHSVRFHTPSSIKTKETESLSQEEQPSDNQQSQQTAIPKKRGRHSATSVCKSR